VNYGRGDLAVAQLVFSPLFTGKKRHNGYTKKAR